MIQLLALVIKAQTELIDQQQAKIAEATAVIDNQNKTIDGLALLIKQYEGLIASIAIREQIAEAFKKHYSLS